MHTIGRTSLAALAFIWISGIGVAAVAAEASVPDRPTFYKDVLPILQANCQDCHRPAGSNVMGMVAPMAFRTYQEVRPWAKGIAQQVKNRTMPPWHATSEFDGIFKNERKLTDAQIETIVRWTELGAPRGRSEDGPAPRALERGSRSRRCGALRAARGFRE